MKENQHDNDYRHYQQQTRIIFYLFLPFSSHKYEWKLQNPLHNKNFVFFVAAYLRQSIMYVGINEQSYAL